MLQYSFCTGNTLFPRPEGERFSERDPECLEYRLALVMIICAGKRDMGSDPSMDAQAVEEMLHHIPGNSPDGRTTECTPEDEVASSPHVQDYLGAGFIHGDQRMGEPANTGPFPVGSPDRLSQDDPDILDQMVVIPFLFSRRRDGEIQSTVSSQGSEHMVEEWDASLDGTDSLSFHAEFNLYVRLLCLPLHRTFSHHTSFNASLN